MDYVYIQNLAYLLQSHIKCFDASLSKVEFDLNKDIIKNYALEILREIED